MLLSMLFGLQKYSTYIAPINNELVLKIHDEGENDE